MADIFLSYAREDLAITRQLAQALEKEGWSVFWDRRIPPGRRWSEYIEEQLSSAQCLITLWSKSSAVSDWVLEEAEVGKERGILVPALIEAEMLLPMGFRRIHAADLIGWCGETDHEGYRELVAAVTARVPPAETTPDVGKEPEPSRVVHVKFRQTQPYFWSSDMIDDRCFGQSTRWILSIQSKVGEADLIRRTIQQVRFCSEKFVPELVRHALPGLAMTHMGVPPADLLQKAEAQYFSLNKAGPCWDDLSRNKVVGVYVPAEIPDPQIELQVILNSGS